MTIGILGGGLTGLTLAKLLHGDDPEVLEAGSVPGGLCRSFEKDGFRGDYGGHMIFSKNQNALDFLVKTLGKNVHKKRRENRVYYQGNFVKYPFENDLASIPPQDRYECLYHFLFDRYPAPRNLEQWCYATFGRGICERYLLPYNRKIWKVDPRKLSMSWVERIPKPPKEDVIKSSLGISTEGYLHQLFFHYPLKGGIGALIQALSPGTKITTGFRVTGVRKSRRGWDIKSEKGEARHFERIISTIPMFDLFAALEPVDADIQREVERSRYNSIIIVLVGLKTPRRHDFSAVYVPDKDIPFHRLCSMDYFSPDNSPKGCSALIAEMTTHAKDALRGLSDNKLTDLVLHGLVKTGFIERRHVAVTDVRREKYGYVVNDLGYENRVKKIHDYLRKMNLPFCGRFAEFRYHNMDDCFLSAMATFERFKKS